MNSKTTTPKATKPEVIQVEESKSELTDGFPAVPKNRPKPKEKPASPFGWKQPEIKPTEDKN